MPKCVEETNVAVVPFPKALYLCDSRISSSGKTDLKGLFNAIRPKNGYPHARSRFCAFAQLINGLGQTLIDIDIRFADSGDLIYTTETMKLTFPDRITLVQMAVSIEGCRFDQPGLYIAALSI